MNTKKLKIAVLALVALAVPAAFVGKALASDHADTPEIASAPGTDLSDVYIFPSPNNPNNVVLAMMTHPLITPGTVASTSFDPNVLYQFKIDNTGDKVEDLVIQVKAVDSGANQAIVVSGPAAPTMTGVNSKKLPAHPVVGRLNKAFTPTAGMTVFCGHREDPFFFDLEQFFTILPDRATPVNGISVPLADANTPKAATWRAPGSAVDFLSNGGFNVLAIVVELPKSMIGGGTNKVAVWCTTSTKN